MKLIKLLFFFSLLLDFQLLQAQVSANFFASDSAGCNPFTVTFTDISTGNVVSWQWFFSDGQSSVLQNPTMTFTEIGFCSVTLIVTESVTGNQDTLFVQDLIHVVSSPHASFQISGNNMGCIPLDVSFIDLSTSSDGNITEWSWDMGDGTILTVQEPTHSYTSPGIFGIHLQVTNEYGCVDDTTLNNAVFASTVPEIHISSDINQYCLVPVDIHFTNNSTGSATQTDFLWDFGDGNTSTDENPVNTYTNLGDYDVILSVTDEYGCANTDTFPAFIHLNQIVADFSTNPADTVCLWQMVEFNNNSGIYCNWYFGDGANMFNVSVATVLHTYYQPGDYTVTLIAAPGDICADTISKDIFVQQVFASFAADQTTDCKVPFTVHFTDQSSSNVTNWYWNFGDGQTSTQQNPSNTYQNFGDYNVTLTVTTSAGCSRSFNLSDYIQIHPPDASFTVDPDNGGCVPITFTFTDTNTTTPPINDWQWTFQGGSPATGSGVSASSTYNTDGTFTVTMTITNDSNCTATVTDNIYVGTHQIPDFVLSKDTVCASDTISFTNLSQDTSLIQYYYWGFSTEFEPEGVYVYNNNVASDTGFTSIQLITDYNGCLDTLLIDSALYVYGPIIAGIIPTFNCDTPYTVIFQANLIDAENWDWDFGDGNTLMASTQDSVVHTYDSTGLYWVKVNAHNSDNGCDFIDSVQIRVTDVQAVLNIPNEICEGDTVFISAMSSVDANIYFFDYGDGAYSGWGYSPLKIHNYVSSGNFIVTLIVQDIHSCRDTITDTILSSNPVAQIIVDTTGGCTPLNISFAGDSSTSEFGIMSYYWDFMDGNFSNDSTVVHIFNNDGIYNVQLTVYDSLGCQDSTSMPITVYHPQAEIIASDTTLCVGVPVLFYGSDAIYNYQWDFGDGQSAFTDTVTTTYLNDTVYNVQLVAADVHGCTDTAYQQVVVQGVDVILNVLDSNIECYTTTPLTSAIIENQTNNAYGAQWLWHFGDGVTSTNYSPGHYYQYPDTFFVSLQATTSYGCVYNDSVQLNVFGPYAVFDFQHDTLCVGEHFIIDLFDTINVVDINGTFGDGNAFNYLPIEYAYSSTGMMNIDINLFSETSHQCGLTLHASVYVVEVNAFFSVYGANNDTAHCSPFNVDFTNNSQGANIYEWDFGDEQSYSGHTPPTYTYQNPNVQDQTYTIQLAIEDQHGCTDTVEHQIIVYGTPEINVPDDQFICKGDSVQLMASGGNYIIWKPDTGLNNAYIYNPIAFPDTLTVYHVTVSSPHNCSNEDSVMITVQNAPSVTYSPDNTIVIGDIADLFINANQPNVSFNWAPNYGLNCTNCSDVYAKPLETTTYQIIYMDSMACFTQMVNITVFVEEKYSIDLPAAFTPNGDGKNDVVYVKGWGIKNLLEFSIYNRWGEQVFTTDDINVGWDGTFKGKLQNIDSYAYYAKGELYSGKEVEKKGTINLFR